MSASPRTPWSPYGLEAHRVALLRRRNRLLFAGIVVGLFLVFAVLVNSIQTEDQITSLSGGNTVDVKVPEKQRAKPTTLSIAPGRTTVLDKAIQDEKAPTPTGTPPKPIETPGLNWMGLLTNIAPPLAAAAYAWRSGKKHLAGPLEQVNLGVYKGAMPLELITAEHRKFVFTSDQAQASLFGKTAQDHLPVQPLVVARRGPPPPAAKPTVLRRGA